MTTSSAKGWRELPPGAVIDKPGSAREYLTGDWRTERPVWDPGKCINCLFCWVYCPDAAILTEDGKMRGINYSHCKGCGICAAECPKRAGAITMVREPATSGPEASGEEPGSGAPAKGGGC
jgi:pyruvate ferredoxin oxidoreductase delta subunit